MTGTSQLEGIHGVGMAGVARQEAKHQELERVDIEVGSDPLTVRVTSRGPFRAGVGTGSGLPGLRDQVEASGGSFTAASAGPATWIVEAALPGQASP